MGNKVIPESLKKSVAQLYVKSLGVAADAATEAKLTKMAETILNKSGSAVEMITQGDSILMKEASEALAK